MDEGYRKPWLNKGEPELINCAECYRRMRSKKWVMPMTAAELQQFARFCEFVDKTEGLAESEIVLRITFNDGVMYVCILEA